MIHNLCSYLQNATRYGYKRIAVPYTKTNKSILMILYEEGLISQVTTGDKKGPFEKGYPVPLTPLNVADRKLWIDLKYRNGESVLTKCKVISKPSRKIFATAQELRLVASARSVGLLKPVEVGQVTIIRTSYGIVELKDALKNSVGGEVLCLAN